MVYPVTAQDELLLRIKALDREEASHRREAGRLIAEAATWEAKAEAVAVLRMQFEYAFTQLGGEFPKPSGTPVPMKPAARVVAALG